VKTGGQLYVRILFSVRIATSLETSCAQIQGAWSPMWPNFVQWSQIFSAQLLAGFFCYIQKCVESSWNVMTHGDAREGKWRGNWRMEWVASTLHTTSEHGVSSITTADAHTSAASSRLNWRPRRFKWTRPFRRKTKSGFCACAITFRTQSNTAGALSRKRQVAVKVKGHCRIVNILYGACFISPFMTPII
jgi:hypothetical protein